VSATDERRPGQVQQFADRAGGPTLYEGTGYQTGVSLLEALALLARQQQSPLAVLRLRCESRVPVGGGQFGFDLGVVTADDDRQMEIKSSPVKGDVLEIVARAGHCRRRPQHNAATSSRQGHQVDRGS
jgi:hypothetical protein